MGEASGPSRSTWRRRCGLLAAAAAATLVALLSATARSSQLGLLRTNNDGLLWAAEPAAACSRWHSTSVLGGGCLAELPPQAASFECCGGDNFTCHSDGYACPIDKLLPALRCVSPRQMLLRLPPGCGLPHGSSAGAAPAGATHATQLRGPQPQCRPSADAIVAGSWVESSRAAVPGVPSLQFQPACSRLTTTGLRAPAPAPPLAGPEALQRLWGAGFDRVVISGDSTVRHLYNRLVGLIRQQDFVIDGGGIAHAHYKLQLWPGSASSGGLNSGGSRGGSSAGGSSSVPQGASGAASGVRQLLGFAPAAAGAFATDELWVSPPANFVKGDWDEGFMEEGLLHLLTRTFPAQSADGSSGSSGSSSSSSSDGNGGGTSSSSSNSGSSGSNSNAQLTVDFVVGAHARWQMRHVRRYLAELAATPGANGSKVLAVLSLCVWEQKHVWPHGWLDFLEEVRQLVGQVVLLTCPTDRIRRANQQEGRKVVAERNRLLREMIPAQQGGGAIAAAAGSGAIERQLQTGDGSSSSSSSSGNGGRVAGSLGSSHGTAGKGGSTKQPSGGARRGSSKGGSSEARGSSRESGGSRGQRAPQPAGPPLMLVDVDGLTQDLPPGLAVAPLDYHYACMLANPAGYNSTGEVLFTGGDGRPQPTYQPMRYDRLLVPPAGRCDDPVNFASLQLLLSLLG